MMKHQLNQELAADRYPAEWITAADWYREHAMTAQDNPDFVLQHLDHPVVQQKLNAEFNTSTLNRTQMFEALAYGDPSFLLTTPGPSLSGVLLEVMGNQQQQDFFISHVRNHTARTFFAVTEPKKGSDAGHLKTTRDANQQLSGQKLLVGNGALGSVGTALFNTGHSLLGMGAVMLTPEALSGPGVHREVLDMYALKGAQLSFLDFDLVDIDDQWVLGLHLSPLERGMMALLKTFHMFRPAVSAMSIGHGQALLDYFRVHTDLVSPELQTILTHHQSNIDLAREINTQAALAADQDPLKGGLVSLAKQQAVAALESLVNAVFAELDFAVLLEDPWLLKSLTDAFGYEYMEGTAHIHLKNVYTAYKRNEIIH